MTYIDPEQIKRTNETLRSFAEELKRQKKYIAKLKELLEVCKVVLACKATLHYYGNDKCPECKKMIEAAIAEAEGRE